VKSKIFYFVVFGLVLAANFILILENYQLNKEVHNLRKIKEFSYGSLDTVYIERILSRYIFKKLEKKNFRYNLIIIFSPEDCPYCIEEITFWADFKKRNKDLGLWGLVNHPHTELVKKFIENMRWKFPVFIIDEDLLGWNFGLKQTPVKVLLDNRNKIYYIEGPIPDWKREGKLIKVVSSLL
jgi:glutaredoxin